MKLLPLFLALASAAGASQTTMTVIAERSAEATQLTPAGGGPVSYVAYDGGYIEAGDPVAGEKPPAADLVRRELATALNTAGYTPAVAPASPAVLITYHWGAIRHDRTGVRPPFQIPPNLRARIALVAAPHTVRKAEDHFNAPQPPYVEPDLRDAFELARDPRYFVIVSAYRYGTTGADRPALLWRVRLSAQENAGRMDTVIASMLTASAPYLGQEHTDPEHVKIPVLPPRDSTGPATATRITETAEPWVQAIARREHQEFAGEANPPRG
jgi:hypothetical protein